MSKLSDRIGGFATIPNTVIKLIPVIGSDAFTLWSYLRYRTNGETGIAFPSYETIKADTGMHFRKIAKALRVLEANELLTRHKRFGNSSEYTLVCPVLPTVEGKSFQRGQTNKTDINKINTSPAAKNGNEQNAKDNPFQAWESVGLTLSAYISEQLGERIDQYSAKWVSEAIRRSARVNKRNLAYIDGILKDWQRKGEMDSMTGAPAAPVLTETPEYQKQVTWAH